MMLLSLTIHLFKCVTLHWKNHKKAALCSRMKKDIDVPITIKPGPWML
jgi:hypothetical protein